MDLDYIHIIQIEIHAEPRLTQYKVEKYVWLQSIRDCMMA